MRYESGEFNITLRTGPKKLVLYTRTDDIRNKWLDFKFQIRFSREQQGRIIASLNDQKVIDFQDITAYSEVYGYPEPGYFYFKVGLYRDKMDQPMTIFIDDFKKQEIRESGNK